MKYTTTKFETIRVVKMNISQALKIVHLPLKRSEKFVALSEKYCDVTSCFGAKRHVYEY